MNTNGNHRVEPNVSTFWNGRRIFLSGGTGSFGAAFLATVLERHQPREIVIFSRDELKQHLLKLEWQRYTGATKLRFALGDVRDPRRVLSAMRGCDLVIHAAALKQIPFCESNPTEAVLTNLMGSQNITEAALECGVERAMLVSTDKAVQPVSVYGATKLISEKIFMAADQNSQSTRFSAARYGNVAGSRGSVLPLFLDQRRTGEVTVTDRRMTRFWISLQHGVDLVMNSVQRMMGGEIFVPKARSIRIMDLVEAVAPDCRVREIGIRPGEKLHEDLLSPAESCDALELDDCFVIRQNRRENVVSASLACGGYSSDNANRLMSVAEIAAQARELEGAAR